MNVLVVGAGAVGSVVGGYLSGDGHNVTFADDWAENVRALNESGLMVKGPRGEFRFRARAIFIQEIAQQPVSYDVICISVKSYDTQRVIDTLRDIVSPNSIIVSTQNGINEDVLAAEFGASHVVGAVTELSGYLEAPGIAVETRKNGGFVIGELDGRESDRIRHLAVVLRNCGHINISQNILGILWSKMIWNSMLNPLTAISGMGTGAILQHDRYRSLAISVGKEGFSVSKKKGVKLEPLTLMGIDPRRLDPSTPDLVAKEEANLRMLPEPLDKMPSMAQDIRKKRKTEIDFINGIIHAYGVQLGVPTPFNRAVIEILHAVERQDVQQSPALLDPIAAGAEQPLG